MKNYPHCYYCDNIIDYPDQFGLLHLDFPRCFVLVNDKEAFQFSTFAEFYANIAYINWLDPSEEWSDKEKQDVLIKLWNFSVAQENEEERRYYEDE